MSQLVRMPDGEMRGPWRGVEFSVRVLIKSEHNTSYRHVTMNALLDPPLGLEGIEGNAYFDRVVEPAFRADLAARAHRIGFKGVGFTDVHVGGWFREREHDVFGRDPNRRSWEDPSVRGPAFDLMAWAAQTIQARRASHPPPWEVAIAQSWPALAQGWGMQLDARRCEMAGVVQGRPTRARIVNRENELVTCVEIEAPLPEGCSLSLARQPEAGFFGAVFGGLVGGGDIIVGDEAFDAAFLVKGAPESFVRGALTAPARAAPRALLGRCVGHVRERAPHRLGAPRSRHARRAGPLHEGGVHGRIRPRRLSDAGTAALSVRRFS